MEFHVDLSVLLRPGFIPFSQRGAELFYVKLALPER
jgi:hypothetical protein